MVEDTVGVGAAAAICLFWVACNDAYGEGSVLAFRQHGQHALLEAAEQCEMAV